MAVIQGKKVIRLKLGVLAKNVAIFCVLSSFFEFFVKPV